jgi:hypothetical protein
MVPLFRLPNKAPSCSFSFSFVRTLNL